MCHALDPKKDSSERGAVLSKMTFMLGELRILVNLDLNVLGYVLKGRRKVEERRITQMLSPSNVKLI